MLERINNQITILKKIQKTINTLEENQEVEQELKQNKFVLELTNQYFEKDIIKSIKEHKLLVQELKENHIKLTEQQKETEKKHKEYIEELKKIIEPLLKLLEKLSEQNTFIDNEIINILKLNEVEDLIQIIKYNKNVNLKKKGLLEEKIEKKEKPKETPIQKEEVKAEPKQKNNKPKRKKIEKILIFQNIEEINTYLNKTYGIEITKNKDVEELNNMIELIENEPFELKEGTLIKKILETSDTQRLKEIKTEITENNIDINEIKDIDELFETDEEQTYPISSIIYSKAPKQIKLELLNKTKERKRVLLKNKLLIQQYGLCNIPIHLLVKKIKEEQLDRALETGHLADIIGIKRLYETEKVTDEQLEDFFEEVLQENLLTFFFGTVIYGEKYLIKSSDLNIEDFEEQVQKRIKKEKNIKTIVSNQKVDLSKYISKNPILKEAEEINNYSKEYFIKTYIPFWYPETNPIYTEKNPYFELIEKEYTSDKKLTYVIPIKRNMVKYNEIEISKNKVIRLLNAHILRGDNITPEIIKKCMYYNLITTDEILEELDNVLTEQFDKIDKKIKKY